MGKTMYPADTAPNYLVLIGRAADLDWLGQFDTWREAQIAMSD